VRDGPIKLVAAEYLVKMSDSATAPQFLGRRWCRKDLGLWTADTSGRHQEVSSM
jgi:hypothetical protein